MTEIRIKEFTGYSVDDWYQFLCTYRRSFYLIVIPKEYSESEYGEAFLMDFYKATYITQLLSRISYDILCGMTNPYEPGYFMFYIITNRLKALAKLLYYFCNGYDWDNNEEACIGLETDALYIEHMMKEGEAYAGGLFIDFVNNYLDTRPDEENED